MAVVVAVGVARAPADEPVLRLPPDVVYQRAVGADSAVIFRHTTHVALASNRCVACHPKLFRILAPTGRVTHREMAAGASCGKCHDGRSAFGAGDRESCSLCHVGREVASTAASGQRPGSFRGPAPIVYAQSRVSPGPVTFRHSTHMNGVECAACHPRPFAMKVSSGEAGVALHDARACGACHDGKRAFGVESAETCARCHVEKGGRR